MRKTIIAICALLMFTAAAAADNYYIDSRDRNASDSGPGSRRIPWKSLGVVDRHAFHPGDVVYFARGSTYEGGFVVRDSGTLSHPITFTSYGSGRPPSLTNPNPNFLNGNVVQIRGRYIIVDGFYFHDGAQSSSAKDEDVLKTGDVFIAKGADHNTIKNSEVKNSPVGFHVCGQFCLITHNHLHDCNRILAGGDGAGGGSWGPIAIIVSNSYNEISYNRITNYVSLGGKYGADGGALEFDPRIYGDAIHDVKIHHNYSYGNEGFLEVTQAQDRIWVNYNVSNDYQEFILLWQGHDWFVENNTVLRILPKNSVTDVVFAFKGNNTTIRNNIFVVSSGRKVFSDNGTKVYGNANYAGQKHYNNIYFSVDLSEKDPSGLPLAPGEMIIDPRFADYAKGDLHLKPGSPAIDAGYKNGLSRDFDDHPVPVGEAPSIGAYEF
jgi:hypothetical protein